MHVVIITADDLSGYSLAPDLTPNLNALAQRGCAFAKAYTNAVFCQPARAVLMSGLYPHTNGAVGFNSMKDGVPTLASVLRESGYYTAIVGKCSHYRPYNSYLWDVEVRRPNESSLHTVELLLKSLDRPLFLLFNSYFPHRPFPEERVVGRELPHFLQEIETTVIRKDYERYCSALIRLDDQVGRLLELFDLNNTLVIFTSDHGMSFPFVKGNCYELSTNIPLIWSGPNIQARLDQEHLVASVDLAPTLLDYLNLSMSTQGRSYLPLCRGEDQEGWDEVYVQLTRMLSGPDIRIRSLITRDYCYVFNLDQHFPAECVDGWGWRDCLAFPGSHRMWRREMEELYRNDRRLWNKNLVRSEPVLLQKMLHRLIESMRRCNDPVLKEVLRRCVSHF